MPSKRLELGCRFGRLVVLREVASHRTPNGSIVRRVECECDCGEVGVFGLPRLRNGGTKSCGCLGREQRAKRWTTHGGTGRPEYRVWSGIKGRCCNDSDSGYASYGGRGIKVCERWRESFAAFLEDMGERPSPEHSIDRIDNDGDYCPENCRWATRAEQSRNMRSNVFIEHEGESLCVADWAKRYGMTPSMLARRLASGWEFADALSAPPYQGDSAFYLTPLAKRDAAWYREYERRKRLEETWVSLP